MYILLLLKYPKFSRSSYLSDNFCPFSLCHLSRKHMEEMKIRLFTEHRRRPLLIRQILPFTRVSLPRWQEQLHHQVRWSTFIQLTCSILQCAGWMLSTWMNMNWKYSEDIPSASCRGPFDLQQWFLRGFPTYFFLWSLPNQADGKGLSSWVVSVVFTGSSHDKRMSYLSIFPVWMGLKMFLCPLLSEG